MADLIMKLLINGVAVWISAWVIPGVRVENLLVAIVVAVMLAVVNNFVRPLLILLTLPITVLTLGFFILILNALMVLLVAWLVPGFVVAGWGWGLLFSIVLWMVNSVLMGMTKREKEDNSL